MTKVTQLTTLLKTIQILSRGSTMKNLAKRLGVSNKTAYRYTETIEEIGFQLDKNKRQHFYKIVQPSNGINLDLVFSFEEAETILGSLDKNHPLYTSILNKVFVHSDKSYIPSQLQEVKFSSNLEKLALAIKQKKRIIIHDYASANSNTRSDRKVEPVAMQDHYRRLYAYDIEKSHMIQLRTERIGDVSIMDYSQMHTERMGEIETDAFWWIIHDEGIMVELDMSLAAYSIIKEEYPKIIKDTTESSEGKYRLKTKVADLKPVTSLILRLPEEIEVISPPTLIDSVLARIKNFSFYNQHFIALSHTDKGE